MRRMHCHRFDGRSSIIGRKFERKYLILLFARHRVARIIRSPCIAIAPATDSNAGLPGLPKLQFARNGAVPKKTAFQQSLGLAYDRGARLFRTKTSVRHEEKRNLMQFDNSNPYSVHTQDQPAEFGLALDAERIGFIRRTYAHLTGAILALIALEAVLFLVVPAATMQALVGRMMGGMGWLVVLGIFMGVSWMARSWANSNTSKAMQYAGLALYVVAEAVILLPMLYICIRVMNEPNLPIMAAAITAITFVGMTAFVFVTGADLASWGKYLAMGGFVAMGVIVAGIFFGFSLGLGFSALMVALAAGYIMYDTSNVIHHYHTSQHVAASLALFSSVVLLFWYVLRILMMFAGDD